MLLLVLLLQTMTTPQAAAKFFDVCPYGKESIGECLVGLCPVGARCINNHCCIPKQAKPQSAPSLIDGILIEDLEKIRKKKGGPCYIRGNEPIGVCLGDGVCPVGYVCENESCCNEAEGQRLARSRTRKGRKRGGGKRGGKEEEEEEEEEELVEEERGDRKKGGRGDELIVDEEDLTKEEEEDSDEDEEGSEEKDEDEDEEEEAEDEDEEDEEKVAALSRHRMRRRKAKKARRVNIPDAEEESLERSATVISTSHKNVCPVGFPIGECVSRLCPDGYACYKNSCCVVTPEINCEDSLPKCHPHLCDIDGYSEFMTQFCAKTCAKCAVMKAQRRSLTSSKAAKSVPPHGSFTTQPPPHVLGPSKGGMSVSVIKATGIRPELCTDRRSDCAKWASEGFCNSPIYSTAQKMKFCGRSCGFC